jgi:hypothetical protein
LTTTWNLICRSANTINVRIDHIGWMYWMHYKNKCDLDDRVFSYLTITWEW